MSKGMQIYYNAVFGGMGGLLGWWIMGAIQTGSWNIWLASVVVGAGIGACIGALVAAMEGAVLKRSLRRAVIDALKGLFSGMIAGLLGLVLGQIGFLLLQGGFIGRPLGWMLLGGFVGLGEYAVSRKLRRSSYGAVGGLLGGLVGGLLYESLTQLFLDRSDTVQGWLGGVGIVLMGACIGALIALTRQVLSRGELWVLTGRREGSVREIDDSVTVGSSDGCDVYLPDKTIAREHVRIRRNRDGFSIALLPGAQAGAVLGGQMILPGREYPLRHNDLIEIGGTRLQFRGR